MKNLILLALACGLSFFANAQFVGLEVEEYEVHTGMTPDGVDLTGFTTYRLYVELSSPTDFLSAIFAEPDKPTKIETSTSFYQSPFGGTVGTEVNPAFFPTFPSLEWDSFVTIGRASTEDPGGAINTIQSSTDPWITEFNAGQSIIMDGLYGGSWFALNGDVNGQAGGDLKVLIGQFTTDGDLWGVITCQVFPLGVGANFEFAIAVPFSSNPNAVFGCTDENALNFDPAADTDDSSCVFPCALAVDNVTINQNACPGGNSASMILTTSGGQGATGFSLNGSNVQLSNVFNNLSAGTYTLTLSDSQGCTLVEEIVVNDPDPLTLDLSIAQGISCSGDMDGVVSAAVSGGTGEVMYGLSPENLNSAIPEFTELSAGSYTVYAMDENGCSSISNTIMLNDPSSLVIQDVSTGNASCFNSQDGAVTVVASGGTGELMYGVDDNFQTSSTIDVIPGMYTVTVMDENGCTATSADIEVLGGPEITAEVESFPSSCFGAEDGVFTVIASGGNGGFSYSFEGGPFEAINGFENLPGGSYDVTIMDMSGCELAIEAFVDQPEEIVIDAEVVNASCFGDTDGSISLSTTGGVGLISFDFNGNGFGSEFLFSDLAPGLYEAIAQDENACVSQSFSFEVAEPAALALSLISEMTTCFGAEDGSILAEAIGGNGDYTYSIDGENFLMSNSFEGLVAGDYSVEVLDINGCSASADVTIDQPEALSVSYELTIDSGSGDGAIDLTVSGGTGGYSVNWDGPDGFTSIAEDLSGLTGGNYTLNVSDSNGCEYTEVIVLTVGLEEITAELQIELYPNPNNGVFRLNLEGLNGQSAILQITDASGRLIFAEEFRGYGQPGKDINMSDAAGGMYLLNVRTSREFRTLRFTKF